MQNLELLELPIEACVCRVHRFECLSVPVKFDNWCMVVGISEMLVWLVCVIVSKRVRNGHLVCWLGIVYNVCLSHIVRWCLVWGLLVVYVKFLAFMKI